MKTRDRQRFLFKFLFRLFSTAISAELTVACSGARCEQTAAAHLSRDSRGVVQSGAALGGSLMSLRRMLVHKQAREDLERVHHSGVSPGLPSPHENRGEAKPESAQATVHEPATRQTCNGNTSAGVPPAVIGRTGRPLIRNCVTNGTLLPGPGGGSLADLDAQTLKSLRLICEGPAGAGAVSVVDVSVREEITRSLESPIAPLGRDAT